MLWHCNLSHCIVPRPPGPARRFLPIAISTDNLRRYRYTHQPYFLSISATQGKRSLLTHLQSFVISFMTPPLPAIAIADELVPASHRSADSCHHPSIRKGLLFRLASSSSRFLISPIYFTFTTLIQKMGAFTVRICSCMTFPGGVPCSYFVLPGGRSAAWYEESLEELGIERMERYG
jgi:hypothetical protein